MFDLILGLVKLFSGDIDLLLSLLKICHQAFVHLSLLLQVLERLAVLDLLSLILIYNSPNIFLDALQLVLKRFIVLLQQLHRRIRVAFFALHLLKYLLFSISEHHLLIEFSCDLF